MIFDKFNSSHFWGANWPSRAKQILALTLHITEFKDVIVNNFKISFLDFIKIWETMILNCKIMIKCMNPLCIFDLCHICAWELNLKHEENHDRALEKRRMKLNLVTSSLVIIF